MQTLLNNFPLYKTVPSYSSPLALAVCSLIHHVMFQGRNQQSISFQGLSDGDRNKKNTSKWGWIGAKLTTDPERPFVLLIYHLSWKEGKGSQIGYRTQ